MSKKDVLHIPDTPEPPAPDRQAGDGEVDLPTRTPIIQPDEGPAGTPGVGGHPRIIEPVPGPGRYPGVSVS